MTIKDNLSGPGIPVFEEIYPVFSFLLDPLKRLSIPAIFGILGDAAGRDAARRGWGYHELARRNQAWVLIRSKMQINRQPLWGEEIIIRTWPKQMEGVVAYRDFQVFDTTRSLLLAGSSAWTLMDLASRKPVRLMGPEYQTGDLAGQQAIPDKPSKISWPSDMQVIGELSAKYGQMDMNNHVNNSRYIEWILNELPVDILLNRLLREVEVNFISEVMYNDEIQVFILNHLVQDNVFEGFIKNKADNRPAFAARFTFV